MNTIKLYGRVFSGLMEGSRYVQMYRDLFVKYLSLEPYFGTLNVDLGIDSSIVFKRLKPIEIPPPNPVFSPLYVYRAYVGGDVEAYIVKPHVTTYDWRVLELVSNHCLRERLKLRNGDYIEINVVHFDY